MADLERTQRQLRRYRRSVLAAAVSGRLTTAWRSNRPERTEPAEALLERILDERRRQWEADYRAKYEAKGKEPPSGWKSRYSPPEEPDTEGLDALPDGWVWAKMKQVGEVQLGRQRAPKYHEGENMCPYLRVANVFEDRIDTSDVKQMHFSEKDYEKYKLLQGDILLNEGQSLKLVGRPAMFDGEVPGACFQNTLIRFRAYPSLDEDFSLITFRAYLHTGRFQETARQTTSVAHLGSRRFSKMEFPLPPLKEQREIVSEVERLLSVADEAARTVERETARAERLRQSILKEAFAGRLVAPGGNAGREAKRSTVRGHDATAQVHEEEEGAQIEMAFE